MRAIVYDRFGGSDVLHYRDINPPTPTESQVLIDVHYAAVNPIDWKLREGLYENLLEFGFPVVPGWDVSGVIAETGSAVKNIEVGDKVYAMAVSQPISIGTYAEQTLASESVIGRAPQSISLGQAAGVPLAATAARDALFRLGHVTEGQKVLIHQGAGGVGCYAIQLAKQAGAYVYTTCSTKNTNYVRAFGADCVIDYTSEDFVDVVSTHHAGGLDMVLDGVGGETFLRSHSVIRRGGWIITMGDFPNESLAKKYDVQTAFLDSTANGDFLNTLANDIDAGRIRVPETEEFALEQAAEAQEKSQGGHVRGKIVLKVR